MYIDKIIKREALVLVVSVITLVVLIAGISYSLFFQIEEEQNDVIETDNLDLTFCTDRTCNKKYENNYNLIGLTSSNGEYIPINISSYKTKEDALNANPFVFNIKNISSLNANVKIKLKNSGNIKLSDEYKLYENVSTNYINNIMIAITNCTHILDKENATVLSYSSLNDYVILNDYININEDVTYCLWVYLDENISSNINNLYYSGIIELEAEYK